VTDGSDGAIYSALKTRVEAYQPIYLHDKIIVKYFSFKDCRILKKEFLKYIQIY